MPGMGTQRELLAELPHAPFADGRDRLRVGEVEGLGDVPAHHVRLLVARELEDAVPGREDARVLVADDEARRGRRVVVLEQLEHEPEAAVVARRRLLGEAFAPVVVDAAGLAARADEERH